MKRIRSIFFLLAMSLLLGGASAHALLVSVEVMWGYIGGGIDQTALQETYHLQVGSIIQIVACEDLGPSNPDPDKPDENFSPYGTSFLPDTTPPGHQIVASGTVQYLGNNVYGFVTWVNLEYPYDSLYVRVFEATEFFVQQAITSAWGISAYSNISDEGAGAAFTWFDNVIADQTNAFELIPEPSSLAFLLSGGCGMGLWTIFRRRRPLHPPEERP